MVHLINRAGGDTYVHETRLGEYLAAGYKLAAPPKEREPGPQPQKPAKKTTKKE